MDWVLGLLTGAYSLDDLIRWGGYLILVAIVFTETGLLIGLFLPGDSLLITAGLLAAGGLLNMWWLNLLLCAAAIIGDSVGYAIGARIGPRIFTRETMLASRSFVVEKPFRPICDPSHELLRGIDLAGMPPLLGYVLTSKKELARLAMTAPKTDPVLASWRYGLGRSVAFTCGGRPRSTATCCSRSPKRAISRASGQPTVASSGRPTSWRISAAGTRPGSSANRPSWTVPT